MKLQRKNAGGKKGKQHPYHPHPKPLSVQSAVEGVYQELVSKPPTTVHELTTNLPQNPGLQGMSHLFCTNMTWLCLLLTVLCPKL